MQAGLKPRRKDLLGLSPWVDVQATLANLSLKHSPICNVDVNLYREIIKTIVSGATRVNDRLQKAGLKDCDKCGYCGKRQTTSHLFWHCDHFKEARKPFLDKIESIIVRVSGMQSGGYAVRKIKEMINNTSFSHCMICPLDTSLVDAKKKEFGPIRRTRGCTQSGRTYLA